MACSATDIPQLEFPRDEIIEIIPASYNNSAKRIYVEGLHPRLLPGSPEGVEMRAPPSGTVSPMPGGLGTPTLGVEETGQMPLFRKAVTSAPKS